MPKIKKQAKPSNKTSKIYQIPNPFISRQPVLPPKIAAKLKQQQHLLINRLDNIIQKPDKNFQANLKMMKQVINIQQGKINQLTGLSDRIAHLKVGNQSLSKNQECDQEKISQPMRLFESCVGPENQDWMIQHHNESLQFF